jgi:putative hydrolase of the HAD superfamily
MIKAILFDFGQTLVDSSNGFRTAEHDAQQKVFTKFDGEDTGWDQFITSYRQTRKAMHEQSNFSRFEIWRSIIESFNQPADTDQLLAWEREYWQTVNRLTTPFPEAIQVLEALRQNYRLALISNTQGEVKSDGHRLKEFPQLAGFFEVIIISGEDGVPAKPDPQPFEKCLKELGIPPQAAVYVGDDYRIDVEGSHGTGIQPVWLKHHSVTRNWPQANMTVPVITSLDELLDLECLLR